MNPFIELTLCLQSFLVTGNTECTQADRDDIEALSVEVRETLYGHKILVVLLALAHLLLQRLEALGEP